MNWTFAIVQSIIIAGVTSLINYIIFKRQRRIDFTYDHRKHILDKRKEAYSKAEKFINLVLDIGQIRLITDDIQKVDFQEYKNFIDFHGFMKGHKLWISHEIEGNFLRIFALVTFVEDAYKKNQLKDDDAFNSWSEIERNKRKLERNFFQDLTTLDNIELFIKERDEYLNREAAKITRLHR